MSKKTPNKHDDEDSLSFEENVLNLLSELRLHTDKFQKTAEKMNSMIRDFRVSIHGEDIDA